LCSYSRTSQHFMEPEGSLPCSQEPLSGPYSEPDRSSPYHPIPFYLRSNIPRTKSHIHFLELRWFIERIRPDLNLIVLFLNKLIFYREELLAPRPTPKPRTWVFSGSKSEREYFDSMEMNYTKEQKSQKPSYHNNCFGGDYTE
jgi:hypothetical protein